ncbi:MAG: N-acetylmuramoyl-L-alanine amidase [Treponema sp.]|jgi:N-acetylmuramoyl-L-alanine amidase|nr:N-acetylmuramoyl-L-alanine amidase [Treponema sp.]
MELLGWTSSSAWGKDLSLDEALGRLEGFQGGSIKNGTLELQWDPLFRSGVVSIAGHRVVFNTAAPGSLGLALLDSRSVIPVPAPFVERGQLYFPETFIATIKWALDNSIQNDRFRFRIAAIIVDPGHGGKDVGAVGVHTVDGKPLRVMEKDVTLKVSKLLHAQLSAAYPDKRVMLTRDRDAYPSLEDRVLIANSVPLKENEAIVFISIHANASFNKTARGYEVWYLSPDYRRNVIDKEKYADSAEIIPILNAMLEEEFTTESIMIATAISERIKESLGKTIPFRGIKAEEWFVVRNARMPSVLVELGFVTNEEDALLMTNDAYLKKLSDAIYKGIADFITTFEGFGGFTAFQ